MYYLTKLAPLFTYRFGPPYHVHRRLLQRFNSAPLRRRQHPHHCDVIQWEGRQDQEYLDRLPDLGKPLHTPHPEPCLVGFRLAVWS